MFGFMKKERVLNILGTHYLILVEEEFKLMKDKDNYSEKEYLAKLSQLLGGRNTIFELIKKLK